MDDQQSFGRLLKRYRRQAYLTQQELAERAGYSSHYVSMLERGVRRPQPLTVDLLADTLALGDGDREALRASAEHAPPVLASPRVLLSQLPPLIGRDDDIARVVHFLLVGSVQVLTLTGPGGVGKTRLAEHAAAAVAPAYSGGATFVDLAVVSEPGAVMPAIARALKLREIGTRSTLDRVLEFLQKREMLLLLDSFEHVLAAAPAIADLLGSCPRIKVLITSRVPLRLRSEQEFRVQPLALPEPGQPSLGGDLLLYPSVALFVQRARLVDPDLEVNHAEKIVIGDICRRVDGLPLAIELAAARVSYLPLPTLRDRLEHRLRILTGGARDLPARQQRMRDAIAWSYDLLALPEQAIFRQLSVFSGSWSLKAAEAVCMHEATDGDVLDSLGTLVDSSLVTRSESSADEPRYRMLDTIREFAMERLEAAGEVDIARGRHARYYVQLAEQAEPALQGRDQEAWYPLLEQEQDNLQVALEWLLQAGEAEQALRLAGAVWRFWQRHGDFRSGREWLEKGLALGEHLPTPIRAKALWGASWLAYHQGDYARTRSLSSAQLELAWQTGDALSVRNALTGLGMAALAEGRYQDALPSLEEALDSARPLGNVWHVATSFLNLATATMLAGDLTRASALFEEALTLYRDRGDDVFAARCVQHLGHLALLRGDYMRARQLFEQSLRAFLDLGEKIGIADGLEGIAAVRAATGKTREAALVAGAAIALRERVGLSPFPFLRDMLQPYLMAAKGQLGEEAWEAAMEEGRAMPVEQAVASIVQGDDRARAA